MKSVIYGNFYALSAIDRAYSAGRLPAALLIYGEKGLGKKMLAERIASMLLCGSESAPCGVCKSCKMNKAGTHPDKQYAEKSGVKGGFPVAEVRRICSDALIKPNNSEVKVYIFADADNITVQAQNALLKLLEEPPQHCCFIFTASGRDVFLGTILSRVTSVAMTRCTRDECLAALIDGGADSDSAERAYAACGGNIGMCLDYLSGGESEKLSELADELCACIRKRDEYAFMKSAAAFSGNASDAKAMLEMLDSRFCDCAAVRCNAKPFSVKGAALSDMIGRGAAVRLHEALARASRRLDGNVGAKLVLSALCGDIFTCIQGD